MSDLKVEYERAVFQLHFSLGHPIGLYAEALEARVAALEAENERLRNVLWDAVDSGYDAPRAALAADGVKHE